MRSALSRCVVAAAAVALLLAVACQTGAPVAEHARRLVLVCYDGVGADLARQWIDDGTAASGLGPMAELGYAADRLRPVDPTLTSVNHVALITGRPPADHGVVSNSFHAPGTPITEVVNGFGAAIEVETLVQAVRRQGGRVGALLWPGVDGATEDRSGDFGLKWPVVPLVPSALIELETSTASEGAELPSEDGASALVWALEVGAEGAEPGQWTWSVALVDGDPDGETRHDTVAVRGPGEEGWRYVEDLQWFSMEIMVQGPRDRSPGHYGAWCKLLSLDRYGRSLRLYRGPFYRLLAYPEGYAAELEGEVGFWPGPPDDRLLGKWWLDVAQGLDLDSYIEQAERFDRYLDRVAEHAIAHESFQLLLAYHPTPDEYQHTSLVVDSRQWPHSAGSEVAAREGLRRVGLSVDDSVAALWGRLDTSRDALVVVSDHGLMPRHDSVNLNRVLADVGLVKIEGEGRAVRVAPSSPMRAVTSAACAHVYLNLEGREPGGVVSPRDAEELLRRAARALADLSVEGEPVVERIVDRSEASALGLDHPSSGDLVVFLHPGFGTSWNLGAPVIEPSRIYGDHGYLSHHAGMHAMLLARGAGVPRRRAGEVRTTEVAGLVAGWLGVSFP